jgi:hypothetical protein
VYSSQECIIDQTLASVTDIHKALSNEPAVSLFRSIAMGKSDPELLKSDLKLSPKQYYSRLAALSNCYLVKKRSGKLTLTSFGKLVYDTESTIEKGLQDLVKLKVLDSLELDGNLSKQESNSIMNALLQNNEIKAILGKKLTI